MRDYIFRIVENWKKILPVLAFFCYLVYMLSNPTLFNCITLSLGMIMCLLTIFVEADVIRRKNGLRKLEIDLSKYTFTDGGKLNDDLQSNVQRLDEIEAALERHLKSKYPAQRFASPYTSAMEIAKILNLSPEDYFFALLLATKITTTAKIKENLLYPDQPDPMKSKSVQDQLKEIQRKISERRAKNKGDQDQNSGGKYGFL